MRKSSQRRLRLEPLSRLQPPLLQLFTPPSQLGPGAALCLRRQSTVSMPTMNPVSPRHKEYTLEILADGSCVKDIAKAILHTIFFHRYFTPITPLTRDLLDTTLPAIDDANLETLIDQRATTLVRVLDQNDMAQGKKGGGRAQIAVQFAEKKRKKSGYFWGGKGDDEVVWEVWVIDIAVPATPRTDSGKSA